MAGEVNISPTAGDFQLESKIKQIQNNPAEIFLSPVRCRESVRHSGEFWTRGILKSCVRHASVFEVLCMIVLIIRFTVFSAPARISLLFIYVLIKLLMTFIDSPKSGPCQEQKTWERRNMKFGSVDRRLTESSSSEIFYLIQSSQTVRQEKLRTGVRYNFSLVLLLIWPKIIRFLWKLLR